MKNIFLFLVSFLMTATIGFSQDAPQSCDKVESPFANARGEVIAESKVAKEYYMNSNAPDAGSNYDERRANLRNRIAKILANYEQKRRNEYSLTTCTYYKTKSATSQSGRIRRTASIVIANKYEFIRTSIERTRNGDWKGGPTYNGKTVSWVTGTESGRAVTFVRIKAKYTNSYVTQSTNNELSKIKLELNNLGIPVE